MKCEPKEHQFLTIKELRKSVEFNSASTHTITGFKDGVHAACILCGENRQVYSDGVVLVQVEDSWKEISNE